MAAAAGLHLHAPAAEGLAFPDHLVDPARLEVRLEPYRRSRSALSGTIAFTASPAHLRAWGMSSTKAAFRPADNSSQVFLSIRSRPVRRRVRRRRAGRRRSASRSSRMAKPEGSRLPGGTAALSMRQPNVSLPVLQCRAGLRIPPLGRETTAGLASRVFAHPSSCLPAMPMTSSFRIGTPVPSMAGCIRDSKGLSSSTSSCSNRRTSAPSARVQRCRELEEAFNPARFAMWRLAASTLITGVVPAMTLNIPGVSVSPSRPGARSSGKNPVPHDRQ